MHRSQFAGIIIEREGEDPGAAAEFWGQALGYSSKTLTDPEDARYRGLDTGAKRVEQIRTWWVMEAPTGHRFCVIRAGRHNFEETANEW